MVEEVWASKITFVFHMQQGCLYIAGVSQSVSPFPQQSLKASKGNRTIADLRYGGKYITSFSTFILAPIKS